MADIQGSSCIVGHDFIGCKGRSLKWSSLLWKTKNGVVQLYNVRSDLVTCNKISIAKPASKVWPEPTNKTETQSFSDAVNLYCRHLENCADLVEPLNHLARKKVKFKNPDDLLARWLSMLETYEYKYENILRETYKTNHDVKVLPRVPPFMYKSIGCVDCGNKNPEWQESPSSSDQGFSPDLQLRIHVCSKQSTPGEDVATVTNTLVH